MNAVHPDAVQTLPLLPESCHSNSETCVAEALGNLAPLEVLEALLKHPLSLCGDGAERGMLSRVRMLLVISVVGAATFGAVVGSYRSALQSLYAGVKLPWVVLLTAAVTTAALIGFSAALARQQTPRALALLVIISWARACVVLASTMPLMMLAICMELEYHRAVMLLVGCCAVAGLAGVITLVRGLSAEPKAMWRLLTGTLMVVAMAGTQLSWVMRPYLVRPRDAGVPFLRALDGSFGSAVNKSFDSARGRYESDLNMRGSR